MQPPSGSDLTSSRPALSARLSHATVGLVDEAIHRQLPHTVLYDLLYDDCFAETCNKRRASHTLLCSLNGVKWTGRENLAYALDLPISALRDLDGRASAIISCSHPTYVFEVRMNKCQIQITFATCLLQLVIFLNLLLALFSCAAVRPCSRPTIVIPFRYLGSAPKWRISWRPTAMPHASPV